MRDAHRFMIDETTLCKQCGMPEEAEAYRRIACAIAAAVSEYKASADANQEEDHNGL